MPFFRWTRAVARKLEGVVAIDGKTVSRSRDDVIEIIKDSKENPTTAVFANLGYYKSYFRTFLKWNAILHLEKKCNCCITRTHIESDGDVYPCDPL